jgi:hypothetical protein
MYNFGWMAVSWENLSKSLAQSCRQVLEKEEGEEFRLRMTLGGYSGSKYQRSFLNLNSWQVVKL